MSPIRRRTFVRSAATGVIAFTAGGVGMPLPREARAQRAPFQVLSADEASRLEAVGDTLVPGAREAGIAHFIDQQCSVPSHEALLGIRIAGVNPPFIDFYRAALTEIDRQCAARYGKSFAQLAAGEQYAFIDTMRQGKHPDWQGSSTQQAVFGSFRGDAVDVVYGTVEGFEALGVPYMPHVAPARRW